MPVLHEGRWPGECILTEASGQRSRDNATIAQGENVVFEPSTVLGEITATGAYAPLNLTATDGAQNAAAIAIYGADAREADAQIAILARDCEVKAPELVWPEGVSEEDKAAQIEILKMRGIIAR